MKTEKLTNKQLTKLKCLAYKLFVNKQITRKLYRLILEVDKHETSYVVSLKALTEDLLRVKGYYTSQVRIEACDKAIDEWLTIQS